MNSMRDPSRLLGATFLLQATTSLLSGLTLALALIVPGTISATMVKIANHTWILRSVVLCEMVTISAVILLAAILFCLLRSQNELMALTALALYILESAIGAARLMAGLSLENASQEFVRQGRPEYLQAVGNLSLQMMDSAYKLLMLPFCLGAMCFYYLLYKSRYVPTALSLWGLLAVFPVLAGTVLAILGLQPSWMFYLPYIPFEFVIGIWIMSRGLNEHSVGDLPRTVIA